MSNTLKTHVAVNNAIALTLMNELATIVAKLVTWHVNAQLVRPMTGSATTVEKADIFHVTVQKVEGKTTNLPQRIIFPATSTCVLFIVLLDSDL